MKDVKHHLPQYIAEFIGTFFLVFFGCSMIVQGEIVSGMESDWTPVVFGATVSIMIYAVGHISGAHFNPAVTVAFWAVKRFPGKRIAGYLTSQVLGAITASAAIALVFGFDQHSFGSTEMLGSVGSGVFVELLLSFSLMFVIISVATDSRAVGELAGIAIGTTVAVCAMVGGPITGASMNPARSLGPALFAGDFLHLWVYLIVPVIGAVLAAKTYEWIRCQREAHEGGHGCC